MHPSSKGISIEELAKIVDPVFRENYGGGYSESEFDGVQGDSLPDLLAAMTGAIDDDIITALIEQLEENGVYRPEKGDEPFYSEEFKYFRDRYSLEEHGRLWNSFCKSLVHGQRFFNLEARELIERIFRYIHISATTTRKARSTPSNLEILRAVSSERGSRTTRPKGSQSRKMSLVNLGPPSERLRKAGRLNPAGISCFYGAFDLDTCVAELRPDVAASLLARSFRSPRPSGAGHHPLLKPKPRELNIFARRARERSAQWRFMKKLYGRDCSTDPTGAEHLNYIPTQAVAEYLVRHHRFTFAGHERTIDAIIYGSAEHPGGRNIALLGDASVVGPTVAEPPAGSRNQPRSSHPSGGRSKARPSACPHHAYSWKCPKAESSRCHVQQRPASRLQ